MIPVIKNHKHEIKIFRYRLFLIVILLFLFSLVLVARLAYLQIYQHKLYNTLSYQNHFVLLPIEPNRGLIFDRNGVLLAENVPIFSLDLLHNQLKNFKTTLPKLRNIINISDDELEQFYKLSRQRQHANSVPLKLNLTNEDVSKFYLNRYRLPGLTVEARLIRNYPLKDAMVSVVGYVGRINSKELSLIDNVNYSSSNFVGKIGIEKYYESILHGEVGYQQVEVDANGRVVRVLKQILPKHGKDIYLTIDSNLQKVAQEAFGTENGAAVVIDPKNGDILALASNPGYDPNQFVSGISNKDFKKLQNDPSKPMYNRAIRGQFPLASAIKPFIALQGLDSGVIKPDFTVFDPGWFKLKNSKHVYRDWEPAGHGKVDVKHAIIVSCDVFFYHLAVMLGINSIDDILRRFGFGEKTGVDILEELSGNIASPAWKMKKLGARWFQGDTVNSGIGQGYMLTTPLQLAYGVAAIANRGIRFAPHFLLKTKNTDGSYINFANIVVKEPVKLKNPKNWDIVIDAMQGVITSAKPVGTGRSRFGHDVTYSVAAKTGTAQLYRRLTSVTDESHIKKHLRNNSLFIAFAPVDKPQIAVSVIVENSMIAANIARKIMDYYFLKE